MSDNDPAPSPGRGQMPPPEDVAPRARQLLRLADKVALATIDLETGAPFLSLTGVATTMAGRPVLLLSTLARHTRNLAADPRASLLFDGTGDHANPLTEDRLTVTGEVALCRDDEAGQRFMARHPKAFYAGFADFAFHELAVETAHFVGGFGTALAIPPEILLLPVADCAALAEVEADMLTHMNKDHADAVRNMAVNLLHGPDGAWQLTGLDPEGCDFMLHKTRLRLPFDEPVRKPLEMRAKLVDLAKAARLS